MFVLMFILMFVFMFVLMFVNLMFVPKFVFGLGIPSVWVYCLCGYTVCFWLQFVRDNCTHDK